ncbi:UNVERIFIED_CONTAM: hypothetical protein RMT77_012517 [Armadillidium vulgare]
MDPVSEKPCEVKIKSYGPIDPTPVPEGEEGTDDVEKAKCKLKDTKYRKLTAKYFRDAAIRREEERSSKETFFTLREDCLRRKELFVDKNFPPSSESISFNGVTERRYEWRRPFEIVRDPRFFVEGATRFDIQQGELGDCWLLAAIATLTLNPKLFHFIVPCDQGFYYKYAGIFHFRFWQYGRWQDVYVDDLLPTYRGRLVFMHSKTKNEFWCALLEKAYAKLYGGYEALKGGNVGESMVDLSGGVVEMVDLREPPSNLFGMIRNACRRGAMMGCGIEPEDPYAKIEGRLANGLITRHAYSVTKATVIPYSNRETHLLRLHNPWGNEAEWTGAWSDKSYEWNSVSEDERDKLGITFDDDGEFWMPFSDFISNFTAMDICDVTPDVFTSQLDCDSDDEECIVKEQRHRQWKMRIMEGEWIQGKTAGGCRNFLDTFHMNPQKVVLLDRPDDDDPDNCTLVVSVMQKYVRQRKRYGIDYIPIGFAVYKLPPGVVPGRPLDTDFFRYNATCGRSPCFLNTREVSYHFSFPPGVYVVIPSTFEPHCEAEFLLRIFTESH